MKDDGDVWKAAFILLGGDWNLNCRADATGIILFDLCTISNGQNVIINIHQSQSMVHTLLLSTSTTFTSYLSDIDLIDRFSTKYGTIGSKQTRLVQVGA